MKSRRGFTLLEILLVVAGIAILAGIVILAINPSRQLSQLRNTQRRSDVNALLNAVYQYVVDNRGAFPGSITSEVKEICQGGVAQETCDNESLVYLGELIDQEKYLVAIPKDPNEQSAHNTGYQIQRTDNGRIYVDAPNAEIGEAISVTR